jgi:hypothetical protein
MSLRDALKNLSTIILIVVGIWSGARAQPNQPSLQQLYDHHNWFELRDAIAGRTVSALYSGAVASAFNRRDAEKYLNEALRQASTTEAANEVREALINLYLLLGRSADAVRTLDAAVAAAPSRADFLNVRRLFDSFRRLPNQTARIGRRAPFRCQVGAQGVFLPIAVNGRPVEWLLDTAFSTSALTESEARMLGIRVQGATAQAGDFTGATTTTRAALAERVVIGDAELRNVPMLVFPDAQPPWNEEPPGRRGTIGIPVALALQALHWTARGTCQVGPDRDVTSKTAANLAFDGMTPVTRAQMEGNSLDLVFDTGNQGGTQLWSRFTRDFPALIQGGREGTKRVSQIGGSTEHRIVVIPEIRLRVGGFETVLRPANVFSQPVGNDLQHGNLGVDVVSQAAEVTIDFQAMRLTMR